MTYVFLVLGAILVLIFVSKRTAKVTLKLAFLKAVASVCFILTSLFAMVENPDCPKIVGALVATGGVWGLLGDIALDLKYVFKSHEKEYLNAGFSSFGVGHIFYIAALYINFGFNLKAFIGAIAAGLVCVAIVFLAKPIMKLNYRGFRNITIVYMFVLGYVYGLASGYAIFDYSLPALIFTIGFILFLASDIFLSGLYFGQTEKKRTSRPAIVINHLLYYAAQFTVAVALLFIK